MALITQDMYQFDELEVQPFRRALYRNGEKLPLAPKTFDVLLCLVSNAGRVVLKEELRQTVWPESFVEDSNLAQHIFWLRKTLGEKSCYIVTVPGRGYEFTGPVRRVSSAPPEAPALSPRVEVRVLRTTERIHTVVEETSVIAVSPGIQIPAGSASRVKSRGLQRILAPTAAVALGALAMGGIWFFRHRAVPGDHHEVVLADFENSTGDPDFDRVLKTLLTIDLNQSPYLTVAGETGTRHILGLMNRSPDETLTPAIAREVCQRMNDQVVLSGAIARFGEKFLVTLTANDCARDKDLVIAKAVADNREGVLTAVDAVASEIRQRLGEPLKSRQSTGTRLQLAHTFSLDALRAYSQARSLELAASYHQAVPLYQHAIELDPRFAAAYLGLATCYHRLGEVTLGRAAITRAYELRDQEDDILKLRITSYYHQTVTGDLEADLRNMIAWTEIYPNQAEPWIGVANLQHELGRHELAIEPGKRGVALEPDNGDDYVTLAASQMNAGHLADAKATCLEAVRRRIDGTAIHVVLYSIAVLEDDPAAAEAQMAWAKGKEAEARMRREQAYLFFSQGKAKAARALWLQMVKEFRQQGLEEQAMRQYRVLLRREGDFGLLQELREDLRNVDPTNTGVNTIIVNAQLGRTAVAESGLKALATSMGSDTQLRYYFYPQAEAAIDLARHQPEAAIAALETALPYDFISLEADNLRGQAYLDAKQPVLAEREFRRVVDHHFAGPIAPTNPLAHLGLARAYAMEGNPAASRQEYQALFSMWKDADPDLPTLLEARAEYTKIP